MTSGPIATLLIFTQAPAAGSFALLHDPNSYSRIFIEVTGLKTSQTV